MTELLRADHLTRHFKIGGATSRGTLHAVDDVSFGIGEREIVALAGESGSGKSTIARLLAKLYKPTAGEIYFQGQPVSALRSRADALRYTGLVPMVFQDPFSSINPVLRISHGILRGLKLHRPELSAAQRRDEAQRVRAGAQRGDGLALEVDLARGRLVQLGQQPGDGALAAAALPGQGHDLPLADGEADLVDGVQGAPGQRAADPEVLGQALGPQQGLAQARVTHSRLRAGNSAPARRRRRRTGRAGRCGTAP